MGPVWAVEQRERSVLTVSSIVAAAHEVLAPVPDYDVTMHAGLRDMDSLARRQQLMK